MKSIGAAENCVAQTPLARFRTSGQRTFAAAHLNNAVAQEPCRLTGRKHTVSSVFSSEFLKLWFLSFAGVEEVTEYDPNLLSDPQWPCGRHKRVLIFSSYMVSFCSIDGSLQGSLQMCAIM